MKSSPLPDSVTASFGGHGRSADGSVVQDLVFVHFGSFTEHSSARWSKVFDLP